MAKQKQISLETYSKYVSEDWKRRFFLGPIGDLGFRDPKTHYNIFTVSSGTNAFDKGKHCAGFDQWCLSYEDKIYKMDRKAAYPNNGESFVVISLGKEKYSDKHHKDSKEKILALYPELPKNILDCLEYIESNRFTLQVSKRRRRKQGRENIERQFR